MTSLVRCMVCKRITDVNTAYDEEDWDYFIILADDLENETDFAGICKNCADEGSDKLKDIINIYLRMQHIWMMGKHDIV